MFSYNKAMLKELKIVEITRFLRPAISTLKDTMNKRPSLEAWNLLEHLITRRMGEISSLSEEVQLHTLSVLYKPQRKLGLLTSLIKT